MRPEDVYAVLKGIHVTRLHHANTVTTSCTFLENGGLLSRGYVESHGLLQTPQPASDDVDKKVGIWDCVFVDHVDIHLRAGRVKGPNAYGPVLFVFGLDSLLTLPVGSEVWVTKTNPIHWKDGESDDQRWFLSAEELSKDIGYGDFDKMLVIFTPEGKVSFAGTVDIRLDDPQRDLRSGVNAFAHAVERLQQAAKVGGVEISIEKHGCRSDCVCIEKYKVYEPEYFDSRFC